ncbi:ABC transporter ATP-binding protein [Streptomyces sp. NPDC000134]|jgi:ABC-type multidrug transport system fused ATPase/permease subunit|uniref:ABC transporter ATP-binding protein n=1 Tax=Streptomyces sp. NPDC000134 TaxID=3364536 RepID=UPI0036C35DF2
MLVRYLRGERTAMTLLAVLVPSGIALQLVAPYLLRAFIDGTLSGDSGDALTGLATWSLAAALGVLVVTAGTEALSSRVAWRSTDRLRADLVAHCLSRPPDFYRRHPPGELVERMDGDVTRLAAVMSALLLELLAQALLIVGILIALFELEWRLALVFAPFAAGTLLLLRALVGHAMPFVTARQRVAADLQGFLEERLAAAEDLRVNGAARYTLRELGRRQDDLYRRARQAARASTRWPATVQSLSAASVVLALAVSAWLHSRGQLSTGTAFAALSYAMLLRRPLLAVTTRFRDLEDAAASVQRLRDLLGRPTTSRTGDRTLPAGRPGVRFDRVSFCYEPGEPVLRDVSFTLRPGERLGVVGRTGSGKSTVVRLLFGLHRPVSGTVSAGGLDVTELDPRALRDRVALVTQEVHVFHAALRDNLTFFDPAVPDDELHAALGEAGLGPWLRSLPDGLDTVLGAGARGMSAGEEQQLALARVFLRDPGLVLMDEPTARLDPYSERLLVPALERLLHGRTAVVVEHRPHLLRTADRILVLEDGKAVEEGERTALAADPASHFHELLRTAEAAR